MNYDLLINLHKGNKRQGPGGDDQTKQAIQLSGLMNSAQPLKIADIGCGTGASTLILAENLNATITAVDLFQDFLDILNAKAQRRGVIDRIKIQVGSMAELPFKENSLDVIWAEGAIYNMGFVKGVAYFKRFLKPGGILALSEITWLTNKRPQAIQQYWDAEYPEITIAADKIRILHDQGFMLKGYFPLPESSWIENYYTPLENSFDDFIAKHDNDDARAIITTEKTEIALYKKHKAYYSYGFYIAKRLNFEQLHFD